MRAYSTTCIQKLQTLIDTHQSGACHAQYCQQVGSYVPIFDVEFVPQSVIAVSVISQYSQLVVLADSITDVLPPPTTTGNAPVTLEVTL